MKALRLHRFQHNQVTLTPLTQPGTTENEEDVEDIEDEEDEEDEEDKRAQQPECSGRRHHQPSRDGGRASLAARYSDRVRYGLWPSDSPEQLRCDGGEMLPHQKRALVA